MIPIQFKKTKELYKEYLIFLEKNYPNISNNEKNYLTNPLTDNLWREDLEKSFKTEFEELIKTSEFFIGCKSFIIKDRYENRLLNYLDEYYDSYEIDFILKDYNFLNENEIFEFSSKKIREQIKTSYKRQREFLEEKISSLGYIITSTLNQKGKITYSYYKKAKEKEIEPVLDWSETSIAQKIIYLELLGVLDYLRSKSEYGLSNNQLASILSGITGERSSTLQSYINPINNPTVSQNNNPLSNLQNVQAIKSKLIDVGLFSLK